MNIQDVSNELSKKGVEHSQTGDPESIGMKGVPQIVIYGDGDQVLPDTGDLFEFDFQDIESLGVCISGISEYPEYHLESAIFFVNYNFNDEENICTITITEK